MASVIELNIKAKRTPPPDPPPVVNNGLLQLEEEHYYMMNNGWKVGPMKHRPDIHKDRFEGYCDKLGGTYHFTTDGVWVGSNSKTYKHSLCLEWWEYVKEQQAWLNGQLVQYRMNDDDKWTIFPPLHLFDGCRDQMKKYQFQFRIKEQQ